MFVRINNATPSPRGRRRASAAGSYPYRARALSLSLVGAPARCSSQEDSYLLSLPPEVLTEILGLVLSNPSTKTRPSSTSCVCKALATLVDISLYTHVTISSSKVAQLFFDTLAGLLQGNRNSMKTSDFLAGHVRRLTISNSAVSSPKDHGLIQDIVQMCASTVTSLNVPFTSSLSHSSWTRSNETGGPVSMDIGTLDWTPQNVALSICLSSVTHLRICDPGEGRFMSPTEVLSTLDPESLPNLTHLYVARRANANEDNDVIFANDLVSLLHSRPKIKLLVVSVLPSIYSSDSDVQLSSFWQTMEEIVIIHADDGNVVLRAGNEKDFETEARYPFRRFWSKVSNQQST